MRKIINWLSNFFTFEKRFKILFLNEFPKKLKDKTIYIEGDIKNGDYWYSKFFCPCGCGDILTLNLMNDTPPSWNLNLDSNSSHFSFHPSIRRKIKCKSHFWIIKSQIVWCKD
ncbi:DUF6527 family protein [Chryseobacterium gleum]|uniref:DUF6527 family protein n=1 Tax=Chryseobacterium gleum TaxID=250 RepID=UPI0028AAFF23|nr:DUF6527 family protein [Chryseobacterium gleum]